MKNLNKIFGYFGPGKIKLPDPFEKQQYYPDARKHQLISFIKSGIRLVGYIFLPFDLYLAMGILIVSEVIGIIEELV